MSDHQSDQVIQYIFVSPYVEAAAPHCPTCGRGGDGSRKCTACEMVFHPNVGYGFRCNNPACPSGWN